MASITSGSTQDTKPRLRLVEPRRLATEQRRHDAAWVMDVGAMVLGALFIVVVVWLVAVLYLSLRVPS